jgi:hypothetical protein
MTLSAACEAVPFQRLVLKELLTIVSYGRKFGVMGICQEETEREERKLLPSLLCIDAAGEGCLFSGAKAQSYSCATSLA